MQSINNCAGAGTGSAPRLSPALVKARPRSSGEMPRLQLASPFPREVAFVHAHLAQLSRFRHLPEERELLAPHAAARRVAEFSLGRGCARAALGRLDPALADAPILRTRGRMPCWPQGYVGAITHHRGHAAAAAARVEDYRGLGLDLETLRPLSQALLRRILRPEEHERLWAIDAARRAVGAMVIFSAKESIFKAVNPIAGAYLGFQDAAVEWPGEELPCNARGRFRWRLYKDCGPGFPAGYQGEGEFILTDEAVLSGVWLQNP